MNLEKSKAYTSYVPFTRPVIVSEARTVDISASLPTHFEPGSRLWVAPAIHKTALAQSVPVESPASQMAKDQPRPTATSIFEGFAKGVTFSTPPVYLTTVPNTTSANELAKLLTKFNIAPANADSCAQICLSFLRSNAAKIILLGLAGGILTLITVEASSPAASWHRKLEVSFIVAIVVAIVVAVLLLNHFLI